MTVFGIDLGVRKVAVAVITEGLDGYTCYGVSRLILPKQGRDEEMWKISGYVQALYLTHEPEAILIESPIIGNNRRYSMQISETCGAVLSGLGQYKLQYGAKTIMVDNNTWKSQVIGDGHANKDSVRNYIHVTHPAYAPFCGDDQDAYDACCIALYGVQLLDRAKHLSL